MKAKQTFDQVFKGIPLPNKKSITSSKQKENRKKVRKRSGKRLNKIQEEVKQKIIKVDSPTDDERADQSIITREMHLLNKLDQLRAYRYKAGPIALLKNGHWDPDAKKCLLAKIAEWELERGQGLELNSEDGDEEEECGEQW